MSELIVINSTFIKLDSLLKLGTLVMSGGEAKQAILDGQVWVNGQVEIRRGRKLYPGDTVRYAGSVCVLVAEQTDH